MTEFFDREMQHIDRVEPPAALEGPTPLFVDLDQRDEDIELVAFGRAIGRAPKLFDLREGTAVVVVGADRANVHGGLVKTSRLSGHRWRRIRHAFQET